MQKRLLASSSTLSYIRERCNQTAREPYYYTRAVSDASGSAPSNKATATTSRSSRKTTCASQRTRSTMLFGTGTTRPGTGKRRNRFVLSLLFSSPSEHQAHHILAFA